MRLIDGDGNQLGIVNRNEALRLAEEQNKDLVEIAPEADPPVCKLLNYSKFKYEQEKKLRHVAKAQREQQRIHDVKEIRLRPKIGEADLLTKARQTRAFIEKGHRVKVTLRFRGREITHPAVARAVVDRFCLELDDIAKPEQRAQIQGREMVVTLVKS